MTTAAKNSPEAGFSTEERVAMKQRAAELKAEARRATAAEKLAAEKDAFDEKIAGMPSSDRVMAERLSSIVAKASPDLQPKLYYGQPGWARDGKVVVFFRSGIMDKARYSTLGFSEEAALDESDGIWPTSYALDHLSDAAATAIAERIARAIA